MPNSPRPPRKRCAGPERHEIAAKVGGSRKRLIAAFDEGARRWRISGGVYTFSAGFDSASRGETADVAVGAADLPP